MSIELEHVSHIYRSGASGTVRALRDVTLHIGDGESVAVMGRTGCGKSTLLQLVAGLLAPAEGRVLLDGADINAKGYDRSLLRRRVGIVFQYPECQLFETTVEKDVAFGLRHSGLGRGAVVERVRWALETMGFDADAIGSQSPLALSGGEKRRVAIAGVLALKPRVLLLDEPIAGLDPPGREAFLRLAARLNRDGVTILMVTHNADAACGYAKRVVVLADGALLLDGAPRDVFADVGRMRALRLGVSAPRELADLLSRRGMELPKGIVAYPELLDALKARLGGRSGA